MQIILADAMGMCFGVRDALAATERVREPAATTILGELVHNPAVGERLAARGFARVVEEDREAMPASAAVLITAHGVSNRLRLSLAQAGKEIVDTTCPLVKKAHAAALRLEREGYFVIIIGKPGHVEVAGLAGDLASCAIIERAAEVRPFPHKRLGILCQTTTAPEEATAIHAAIIQKNPQAQIRFVDTICQPTKDRQAAMERLLDCVDAVVVVGGKHSNNTRKLAERSGRRGIRAIHIEAADELCGDWFEGCLRVGLTAGTSTLPETIAAVHARLLAIARAKARHATN